MRLRDAILVNRRARSLSYRQSRSLARLLTNNGFEARFSNCTRSDTRVEGRTWCHPSAGMINPVLIPEPLIYCREQCCSTHFTAHLTTKYTCILQLNWTECKLYWPRRRLNRMKEVHMGAGVVWGSRSVQTTTQQNVKFFSKRFRDSCCVHAVYGNREAWLNHHAAFKTGLFRLRWVYTCLCYTARNGG